MARYAVDGAILEVEGACHIATGIPNAFFNPVFLQRGGAPDDLEGFQRRARAFYQARGDLPWTLVVSRYEEEDEPQLSSDRLMDAGMIPAGSVPVLVRSTAGSRMSGSMGNDLLPLSRRGVLVERVEDLETLAEHRDVLAEAFGLPSHVTDLLIPELPPPTMRLYVACREGEVVGTASLLETSGVGGIYNLGTHPSYRRQGIATALLRHVLDEACWECGLTECVVQAPRASLPLFRQMGFAPLGVCLRYVEPQHLPPGEGKKRSG